MNTKRPLSIFLLLILNCAITWANAPLKQARSDASLSITKIRCENNDAPLGIDHPQPRLSWQMESGKRGEKQSAYRILISSNEQGLKRNEGDLLDTGKVDSAQSIGIPYSGSTLTTGQRCYWKVQVWDKSGTPSDWSQPSFWEMGLLDASDWQAKWIGDGKPTPKKDEDFFKDDPAPLFRRPFKLSGQVQSARLYITALGYYSASLNGEKIGDQQLDPIWTLPHKRVFYSTYDVTDSLSTEINCLGVTLGNGWYNPLPLRLWGRVNLRERLLPSVGRPQFIARLQINYTDGKQQSIVSDDSWKVTAGPIIRNNIYLGEKVDARNAIDGWDQPDLDDSQWANAVIAQAPIGELIAQPNVAIKVTKKLMPVAISEPKLGVYIVDMGQNFAGWAKFNFNVPAGTEIKIRYGELVYKDGTLNPMTSVCGQIKNKNGKSQIPGAPPIAWQEDIYIARGGGETYIPLFTFHAFRYIELSGLPSRPSLESIEGLRMNSVVEPTGSFNCSNQLFNSIQTMVDWTFLSNLFGVQSDCPHRERFGYGGDLVTSSDALMMNYDMSKFYAKSTRDWADSALPNGMLTDTAPSVGIQYCGIGWAMAHPHLQAQLYRYYGDRRIVEEQYAISKRWFELVRAQNKDYIVRNGLHDHEALKGEKRAPMVTALYCESSRILSRLASILGKPDEAKEYAELAKTIKEVYIEHFVDIDTGIAASGFQNSQSFGLYLDMIPRSIRKKAVDHLLKNIEKNDGHLTTGIFGTFYMLDTLSREGEVETINRMVNKKDFPSWGNMLEKGATTLWEHWEFSDSTFSHNHPMFGSVSQWFYNWLGGIEPAKDAIGFDRINLQPRFVEGIDWVNCSHQTIYGEVISQWERTSNNVTLNLSVPVGTTAMLRLLNAQSITENGHPIEELIGVKKQPKLGNITALHLDSGSYKFEVQL